MTIHAKNCESSSNSFPFYEFLFSEGVLPPSDATEGGMGNFFIDIERGVWYDYT